DQRRRAESVVPGRVPGHGARMRGALGRLDPVWADDVDDARDRRRRALPARLDRHHELVPCLAPRCTRSGESRRAGRCGEMGDLRDRMDALEHGALCGLAGGGRVARARADRPRTLLDRLWLRGALSAALIVSAGCVKLRDYTECDEVPVALQL